MTDEEIAATVARVSLQNSPIPVRYFRSRREPVGISLTLCVTVPDRSTGEATQVFHVRFLASYDIDADRLIYTCRAMLIGAFLHEFAEAYHVDGVRVEDPHANDPPPVDLPF